MIIIIIASIISILSPSSRPIIVHPISSSSSLCPNHVLLFIIQFRHHHRSCPIIYHCMSSSLRPSIYHHHITQLRQHHRVLISIHHCIQFRHRHHLQFYHHHHCIHSSFHPTIHHHRIQLRHHRHALRRIRSFTSNYQQ